MAAWVNPFRIVNQFFNKYQDMRTADFPLMSSPFYTLAICLSYIYLVKDKFRDGIPGKKWFLAFLKPHPEVCERHAESINGARASITEESIRQWHNSIRIYLNEENAVDILDDPRRILNSDESGFATNPKTGLVLGPRGMKNFYEVKSGSEKECITALFTIAADGTIYPPMVVYPYERIPAEIVRNTNPEWVIGRSKKGWMTSETFFSYVCNTLLPYIKQKGVKLPILYILDGHKSHLTYNLSKFCSENGIFLYALLPNATHILQPADVSLFSPLKNKWKKVVFDWKKANNNKIVNKATFPLLLENAAQQIGADTVKNGFRKCGLYPFDVEAIDFTKCMHDDSRFLGDQYGTETVKPTEFGIQHFLYFDSLIPTTRREEFKKAEMGEWVGDESAKELFNVWKTLEKRCKRENNTNKENEIVITNNQEVEAEIIESKTLQENKNVTENQTDWTSGEESSTVTQDNKETETSQIPDLTEKESFKKPTKEGEENVIILRDLTIRKPFTQEPIQHSQNSKISAAFVDHIFWPGESPEKKNIRRKEKLTYATTSLKWLQYHEEKEKIKSEKERVEQEKASQRQKKKEEKLKESENKKVKVGKSKQKGIRAVTYSDSSASDYEELQESGTSLDDIFEHFSSDSDNEPLSNLSKKLKQDISVGDFYLVSFPGKKSNHHYICSVQNIYTLGEIEVQAFTPVAGSKSVFKIIENDISVVSNEQLIEKLEKPNIICTTGNRSRYVFSKDVINM